MEWLEVQIVMLSERLVEKGHIKTLDYDRQSLENKRPFLAVIFIIIFFIPPVVKIPGVKNKD